MRKNVRKPPFIAGGRVAPTTDTTVRNNEGYPLDKNGDIDLIAVAREVRVYESNVLSKKKSNITPPKKKKR